MGRPRLLLVPGFTELEWVIKPQLEEWAEVASYDPPGVGDEPLPDGDPEAMGPEVFSRRGLEELDRLGWERFFVVADTWGIQAAARIAHERPEQIAGQAFGHARLSNRREGERAPVNGEVVAGLTQRSYGEELAQQMIERFPSGGLLELGWTRVTSDEYPIESTLREIEGRMLLAQHEGCLVFTEEGFEDAAATFPGSTTLRTAEAPSTDPQFADALREFCARVV